MAAMRDRAGPVVALAGGVGAARFLRGLVAAVPADEVVAIVNTGDDRVFYGVQVCPDLDIVTYTLAGRVSERGYGLRGDTFAVVDALGTLGHETWFRLGDRDLATCLHRTMALADGAGLAAITDQVRRALGVEARILPMSEDPCPTFIDLSGGRREHFEEYLARDGAPDDVAAIDLGMAKQALPAPGVLEALAEARVIVFCPSNPVVSIGPILAVPGLQEAIQESPAPVVAITPIIAGQPVKGPADRLLKAIGVEVSARGVASFYAQLVDAFVLDRRDADQREDVERLGIRCGVEETLMRTPKVAEALARSALELVAAP
jgi:LPPG:FO 2-phospho-L-lactate transferase